MSRANDRIEQPRSFTFIYDTNCTPSSITNRALGICIGDILIVDKGLHKNKHMHGITHFIMYDSMFRYHNLIGHI